MPRKSTRRPVTIRDSQVLKSRLCSRHKRVKSWSVILRDYPGLKRGTLQRFATTDYEPHRADIRAALGLPALQLAPACPHCGQVRVTRRCLERKPRPKRRNYRRACEQALKLLWGERPRE